MSPDPKDMRERLLNFGCQIHAYVLRHGGIDLRVHHDGVPWLWGAGAFWLLFSFLGWWLWLPACVFFIWVARVTHFPARDTASVLAIDAGAVAMADGVITSIEVVAATEADPHPYLCIRGTIPWHASHVFRSPVAGAVASLIYHHQTVERQHIGLRTEAEPATELTVIMEGGRLFRRIGMDVVADQDLAVGELLGIIRFGSAFELWLPQEWEPAVTVGQQVIGGETMLARAPKMPF